MKMMNNHAKQPTPNIDQPMAVVPPAALIDVFTSKTKHNHDDVGSNYDHRDRRRIITANQFREFEDD